MTASAGNLSRATLPAQLSPPWHSRFTGFTLFEIVIVITLVGLLIGALQVGRHMIRSAELQSVIADVNRYKNAAKLFRDKYKYLPGDFPRAAEFWGAYMGCPTPSSSNTERVRATCDGNGDGFVGTSRGNPMYINVIDSGMGGGFGVADISVEPTWIWQHLSNSGFIEGQYSGAFSSAPGASPGGLHVGLNMPESGVTGSGFTFHHASRYTGAQSGAFAARYGHIIVFGRPEPPPEACPPDTICLPPMAISRPANWPAIAATEASTIDRKIDDGRPGTGGVLSYTPDEPANGNCATSSDEKSAEYRPDSDTRACSLIFITGL